MAFRLHASSVIGHGHIEAEAPNQDAVATVQSRRGWLLVVSDGMGSRPKADVGAQAVCHAARRLITETRFEDDDRVLIEHLTQAWLSRLATLRVRPEQAVATCLLAWGLPDGRFRLLQLGDGLIIGYPDPIAGLVARDAGGFGNETTGIGLSREPGDWHSLRGRLAEADHGLVLMSDGISDDLTHTEGFVTTLVSDLRRRSARAAKATLYRELRDWPVPNHRDDKSIALVYRHHFGPSHGN